MNRIAIGSKKRKYVTTDFNQKLVVITTRFIRMVAVRYLWK